MRNEGLKRFVAELTDALVRFHTEEPREVLKRVAAPPEVQKVFAEVYFGGGLDNPSAVLTEGVAAEIMDNGLVNVTLVSPSNRERPPVPVAFQAKIVVGDASWDF